MIALDTNFILHLLVKSQKEHQRAYHWFSNNREGLCTTHVNVAECLRLITHPRVFSKPLLLNPAVELIENFLDTFGVRVLENQERWWIDLQALTENLPALKGNEIFDAQIALCLRYHGIKELVTLDGDFLKYPFLKVIQF